VPNIISYEFTQFDYALEEIQYNNPLVQKKVATEIRNAWNDGSRIDDIGRLWVHESYLAKILRTTRDNVKYEILQLDDDKKYRLQNELLIRGDAVHQMIDYKLQNAGYIRREHYLRLSEMYYLAARDSEYARNIRYEHYEHVRENLKRMKTSRLSYIDHNYDELTRRELDRRSSEFSHIRSVSLYPELALYMENGLLVNRDTHRTITNNSINDEGELYRLCIQLNWSVDWYDPFINFLNMAYPSR